MDLGVDGSQSKRGPTVRGWMLVLGLLTSTALVATATSPAHAAFPGDNGRIYFVAEQGGIFSMNPDGSDVAQLTNTSTSDLGAVGAADGSEVAFFGLGSDGMWLRTMDIDGGNLSRVGDVKPQTFSRNGQYAWSPDGRIVFPNWFDELMVIDSDGTGLSPLGLWGRFPAVSPDGSTIVYSSPRSGSIELWLANIDGSGPTQLTNSGPTRAPVQPDWSPDGTKVTYLDVHMGSSSTVRVINADGSTDAAVTTGGDEFSPEWSPDGTRIAYSTRSDDSLYTIHPDGTDKTLIGSGELTDWAVSHSG